MIKNMNPIERIKMVKAMEFICRQLNDEEIFDGWLMVGVADGDIPYGNLSVETEDYDNLDYYIDDDNFADLMHTFLRLMSRARRSGGLYCDNIVSKEEN